MKGAIVIVVGLLLLPGCQGEGQPVEAEQNYGDYKVKKLFTVDGCSVYRFHDGLTEYFTSCQGGTQWDEHHYCGKGCYTHEHKQIPTDRREGRDEFGVSPDTKVVGPEWLDNERYKGITLPDIAVDHAARLTDIQWSRYLHSKAQVRAAR